MEHLFQAFFENFKAFFELNFEQVRIYQGLENKELKSLAWPEPGNCQQKFIEDIWNELPGTPRTLPLNILPDQKASQGVASHHPKMRAEMIQLSLWRWLRCFPGQCLRHGTASRGKRDAIQGTPGTLEGVGK